MKGLSNTSYGRKVLFNEILSKELASYSFRIDAFYESVASNRIMSVRISSDQTIHLGINISVKEDKMFLGCSNSTALSIEFRAYFIINYLQYLEIAKEAIPDSLFSGFVTLDAISDLYSGNQRNVYIPNIIEKNRHLYPLDVHCAIRAITRILIKAENEFPVPQRAVELCELYRDTLITYTGMPEIVYIKSKHAQYAALCEMNNMVSIVLLNPKITSECVMFRQVGIKSFDDLKINELLDVCDMNNNRFWSGVVMRVLTVAIDSPELKKYMKRSSMESAYMNFCASSVEYYSHVKDGVGSALLKDNLKAIQRLSRKLEQSTDFDENTINGMIHYIQ